MRLKYKKHFWFNIKKCLIFFSSQLSLIAGKHKNQYEDGEQRRFIEQVVIHTNFGLVRAYSCY